MNGDKGSIAVLGAGSWGTALGVHLARNGLDVRLWGHLAEEIEPLRQHRENRTFLPGIRFPEHLRATTDLEDAFLSVTRAADEPAPDPVVATAVPEGEASA